MKKKRAGKPSWEEFNKNATGKTKVLNWVLYRIWSFKRFEIVLSLFLITLTVLILVLSWKIKSITQDKKGTRIEFYEALEK